MRDACKLVGKSTRNILPRKMVLLGFCCCFELARDVRSFIETVPHFVLEKFKKPKKTFFAIEIIDS